MVAAHHQRQWAGTTQTISAGSRTASTPCGALSTAHTPSSTRRSKESCRRNQFTKEDVKIIVVLELALLNLGWCLDLAKPVGLLVISIPVATWTKALFNLEESMSQIKAVCNPDQSLNPVDWGKLFD
jgi:hypothetical protein